MPTEYAAIDCMTMGKLSLPKIGASLTQGDEIAIVMK
jgi:hypothetical protein